MRDDFLIFGSPRIEQAEIEEVVACMKSGWLGTGPRAARFEQDFCSYKKAHHAIAVNSCTAALHLSLLAAGIGPGDEVITTPMTFCATANAIIHAGATPVFADVDLKTMNIDPLQVEAKLTSRTRALLPVHFAGRPCDMDALNDIARRHDLKIIEDCAHAIETEYRGRPAGTIGDFGCFSFYVTKNVITGEGGMVLTRREEDAARIKVLALHGMSRDAWKRFGDEGYKHYYVVECGFKYNMMDLQAAIGIHQLQRVEEGWRRRREIWERYNEAFAGLPCIVPSPADRETRHAHHLYTLLVDIDRLGVVRDKILEAMTRERIGVGVHYLALHAHPYYAQRYGYKRGDFPNAEFISDRTISIPLSPKLTEQDIGDVIDTVTKVLGG